MASPSPFIIALTLAVAVPVVPSVCGHDDWLQITEERAGCRAHVVNLTDFGAVGDGVQLNTAAFSKAVEELSKVSENGGGLLYVPAGKWLTGPFNVTSHFTLFLHRDAEILATTDEKEWPVIDALPSYGKGRDATNKRYANLIMGSNLTDVIITGDNGTINGQGQIWWDKYHSQQRNYSHGYLLGILNTDRLLISNLKFVNSTGSNIHPVFNTNIVMSNVTIIAPINSPKTDGINPDSCSGVKIEDCYIVSGDDCIAIKSGWDQYVLGILVYMLHYLVC